MLRKFLPYLMTLLCCVTAQESFSYTLEDQYKCVADRIELELALNPKYDWGNHSPEVGSPGDCSGKVYAIISSCGFMVQYVDARSMYKGLGGWKQFPVVKEFKNGKKFTIIFYTLPPKPGKQVRPYGHVGIMTDDVTEGKISRMAHAGFSTGFIKVTVEDSPHNYWFKYMVGFRGRKE